MLNALTMDKILNPEEFIAYSLFTFFAVDEDGTVSTNTILAKHFNEAAEMCKVDFRPNAYHEIKIHSAIEMVKHFYDNKHPRPILLADNNDIKEI